MIDMEKKDGSGAVGMVGTDEIDRLFREADFSAENAGLKTERLWRRFQEKLIKGRFDFAETDGERELTDGELSNLAAAGSPETLMKIPGRE